MVHFITQADRLLVMTDGCGSALQISHTYSELPFSENISQPATANLHVAGGILWEPFEAMQCHIAYLSAKEG